MATGNTAANVAMTRTTDSSGMVGDGEGDLEADGELELVLLGVALLLEVGDGDVDGLCVNTAW